MPLILVKTTPHMQGHYSIEAEPAAVPLVKARPDVWWWCVALEDDGWHKGGAWDVPPEEAAAALAANLEKNGPLPPAGAGHWQRQDVKEPGDGEDDDRW